MSYFLSQQRPLLAAQASSVPLMMEALLTGEQLHQLEVDLLQATTILQVLEKGTLTEQALDQSSTLAASLAKLCEESIRAVQVRYQLDGFTWSDSIFRLPNTFRLVRMQFP